jgi:hypothetical protein
MTFLLTKLLSKQLLLQLSNTETNKKYRGGIIFYVSTISLNYSNLMFISNVSIIDAPITTDKQITFVNLSFVPPLGRHDLSPTQTLVASSVANRSNLM